MNGDNHIPGATIVPSRMLLVGGRSPAYAAPHYPAAVNRSPQALGLVEPVVVDGRAELPRYRDDEEVYVAVPARTFIRGRARTFMAWVWG